MAPGILVLAIVAVLLNVMAGRRMKEGDAKAKNLRLVAVFLAILAAALAFYDLLLD